MPRHFGARKATLVPRMPRSAPFGAVCR